MFLSHMSRIVFSILITSSIVTLAACGGGDDESTMIPMPDNPVIEEHKPDLEEQQAKAERLRLEAEAAEAERLRLEAEAEEAERLRREVEAAEAERLRLEVEAERLRLEELAKIERESVYLAWDYHESPRWQRFGAWQDTTQDALVELSHATFGVVLHEGEYVPWMRGELPEESLYANMDVVQRTYDEYGYWTIE